MGLNIFNRKRLEGIPSRDDIRDIVIYSCMKNDLVVGKDLDDDIDKIINEYDRLCILFKDGYVIGELDTFKRAACLLVAINKCGISSCDIDTIINISIDAGFKLSEKPYWFVGYGCNEPFKLNEVDFDKLFDEDLYLIRGRDMFRDSIRYDSSNYLSLADNLQLWHYVASVKNGIIPGMEMNVSGYGRSLKK